MYIDQVLFRRRNKIKTPTRSENPARRKSSLIATMVKNIETGYGYLLSTEIIEDLMYCTEAQIQLFYNDVVGVIKSVLPEKIYSPMYKNFPDQVMSMSESELYFNAIMHYTGNLIGCLILPEYEEEKRPLLFEDTNVVTIEKGTIEDYINCMKNLFNSSTSLSQQDKDDIHDLVSFFLVGNDSYNMLPEKFNNKEVMVYCLSQFIEYGYKIDYNCYIKTPTDVLRLCVGMSGGDISLSEKPKFKNFKRRERRLILSLLQVISEKKLKRNLLQDEFGNCVVNEMAIHRSMWLRLGEKIHPGEYKKQYPRALVYFDELRNNKIKTINGVVRDYILKIRSVSDKVELGSILESFASAYPGYFVRSLDEILSYFHLNVYADIVLEQFEECVEKVSTNVLLQTMTHFKHREGRYRVFLPKGNVTKAWVQKNNLGFIEHTIRESIIDIIKVELVNRFKQYAPLGTVYLDEELKNYTIPFSQRSASKSLKTISRGSRIPFGDDKDLRFFIYWKNGDYRTDLDISCAFLRDDFSYVGNVSYTDLKSPYAVHSGDITDAPNGASEFIDLDIDKAKEYGVRYCITSVFSYTQQPYCDLPECFVGWMEREGLSSGEIYEPKTVKNIFDLSANTKTVLPIIIDLHTREVIWCDFSITSRSVNTSLLDSPAGRCGINTQGNNVESNITGLLATCMAGIYMRKTSIYDVLSLHAEARADLIYHGEKIIDEIDTDFSVENGTHTDLDTLMGEYLI